MEATKQKCNEFIVAAGTAKSANVADLVNPDPCELTTEDVLVTSFCLKLNSCKVLI